MSERDSAGRPALLKSLPQEEFAALARRSETSIDEALEKGETDRRAAETAARPPLLESNLRFA